VLEIKVSGAKLKLDPSLPAGQTGGDVDPGTG
jgi:hypothetical protein